MHLELPDPGPRELGRVLSKPCPRCKERERDDKRGGYCHPCRQEYDREYRIRVGYHKERQFRRHGITREDFEEMLSAQGGACAICRTTDPGTRNRWAIDHDHSCCPSGQRSCGSCIRGLLCLRCNTALGLMDDKIENFLSAISYLGGHDVG